MSNFDLIFLYISFILHPNIKQSTLSAYSNSLWLYTNILFTVTLNFVFQGQMEVCEILGLSLQDVLCFAMLIKCSKRSYDCLLRHWRSVGVRWGIARATVDVTELGLVLVIG